ncbi:MAG: hypothetical protein FD124_1421 [Alphaproteobacteria bacterium]|nr:MAG: hypothetical protein FD160_3355 [Caulobacteraceae bacterium]TPW07064.1 MAG: hypothetical protein FD124_1421 [Alphaproteobacteria bacterium]
MTLFQLVSVWTLRALIAWGAIEGGAAAYSIALGDLAAWSQVRAHEEVMARLERKAVAAERTAHSLESQIGRARTAAFPSSAPSPLTQEASVTQAIRDDLLSLGAEAPVVETTFAPLSGDLRKVAVRAQWRERQDVSPGVLHGLAARRPSLRVKVLRFAREGDGAISTHAEFEAIVTAPAEKAK